MSGRRGEPPPLDEKAPDHLAGGRATDRPLRARRLHGRGQGRLAVALALAVGAVSGAVIGTHVLHLLPHRTLALGVSMLLLATAARLLLDHSSVVGRSGLTVLSVVALLATGVLGEGGGIVMVPAMVVLFGIPGAVAVRRLWLPAGRRADLRRRVVGGARGVRARVTTTV